VAEAVAEDVGAAVVAVLATEAAEAREAEAAARRLWGMLESIILRARQGSRLRLSSSAVLDDLVVDRRLLVALGAVVVAGLNIGVDVAHADPVVGLVLATLDAILVAGHAGVDNAAPID
jgi:hypothetical protein